VNNETLKTKTDFRSLVLGSMFTGIFSKILYFEHLSNGRICTYVYMLVVRTVVHWSTVLVMRFVIVFIEYFTASKLFSLTFYHSLTHHSLSYLKFTAMKHSFLIITYIIFPILALLDKIIILFNNCF
jgi:hypothetical protein